MEDRRRQILDTALMVFAEKGFANTSVKDLAKAGGISTGLMYHYFPSKEKLLEEAVEHHSFLPQLREMLKDTKDQQYHEVAKNIALEFLNLLEQKSIIVKIFLQEGYSNSNVQKAWTNLATVPFIIILISTSQRAPIIRFSSSVTMIGFISVLKGLFKYFHSK